MTLSGIVWFGRDFDWFGSRLADHTSELSQNVFLALLAHEIIVFLTGSPAPGWSAASWSRSTPSPCSAMRPAR